MRYNRHEFLILRELRLHPNGVLGSQLNLICNRYGGRLFDLKKKGVQWRKRRATKSEFLYVLISEPGRRPVSMAPAAPTPPPYVEPVHSGSQGRLFA